MSEEKSQPQDMQDILESLPNTLIEELCDANNIKSSKNKKSRVENILKFSYNKGVKEFLEVELQKEDIATCLEFLNISSPNGNKKTMTDLLKKEIKKEEKISTFFNKLNEKVLVEFCTSLRCQPNESMEKEQMIQLLIEEILILGYKICFGSMLKSFLVEVCEALDITIGRKKAPELINEIIGLNYPHLIGQKEQEEEEEEEKEEVKKAEFKKGVTFQELYDSYYTNELSDFLKKNNQKYSGSKKILIRRIISFLNE
jgi:hypothetical protein